MPHCTLHAYRRLSSAPLEALPAAAPLEALPAAPREGDDEAAEGEEATPAALPAALPAEAPDEGDASKSGENEDAPKGD